MKYTTILIVLGLLSIIACQSKKDNSKDHQHTTEVQPMADTVKKSIPKEEHAMIGNAHITLTYHAPVVRGRQIWGGLVPFNEVWVTGAHQATSFEIDKDFTMGNKTIPAGKYALFTIPGTEKWIFIINKNWDQHLADDYSIEDDIVRIVVAPDPADHQERLKYTLTGNDTGGVLIFQWEKIKLTVPFTTH